MRLLVTGARGRIGSAFVERYGSEYELTLTDRRMPRGETGGMGRWTFGDLSDPDFVWQTMEGQEAVLHLGANPNTYAEMHTLLPDNILSTSNIFEAAERRNVKRVVFASSIQAVLGYPREHMVTPEQAVRPRNLYAATKCFGEALCSVYAERGMSCIAVRIGAFLTPEQLRRTHHPSVYRDYADPDDLSDLFHLILQAPEEVRFEIAHGVSNNEDTRLDLQRTMEVFGWKPSRGVRTRRPIQT